MKEARDALKVLEQNNEIEKKAIKRQNEYTVEQKRIWVQKSDKQLAIDLAEKKATIGQKIK